MSPIVTLPVWLKDERLMSCPLEVKVALLPIRMPLPPTLPEVENAILPACLILDCWNGGTGDPLREPDVIVTLLPSSMSPPGLNAFRDTLDPPVNVLELPIDTLPAPTLVILSVPDAALNVEPAPLVIPVKVWTETLVKLPVADACVPAPNVAALVVKTLRLPLTALSLVPAWKLKLAVPPN